MKKKPKERSRRSAVSLSRTENLLYGAIAMALVLFPAGQTAPALASTVFIPDYSDMTMGVVFSMIVVIFANALFVAAETSIDLLRPSHIRFAEKEDKNARVLQELYENKSKYVASCTLGSQTMRAWMIILSFVPAPGFGELLANRFGWSFGFGTILLAAVIITVPVAAMNLILGELVPKSYAGAHPQNVATKLFGLIRVFTIIFAVPATIVMGGASLITSRFGAKASFALPNQAEEEIKDLVETAEESGEIESDERELLHSVFEFSDTVAREVMTPRVDMDALPVDSDPRAMIELIQDSGHSRIPVYDNTDDEIVGIVHAKDLLLAAIKNGRELNLRELMRPAIFVPENKNLHELLKEMRLGRSQLAVVQDEFGGTAGIVSIEDIVEELVGEIVDEYDVEEPDLIMKENGFVVDGKKNLDDLNSEIGTSFDSEEFDTIGGYVFGLFGRQPKCKEFIDNEGYRFEVEETDGRRISRIYVERLPEGIESDEEATTE